MKRSKLVFWITAASAYAGLVILTWNSRLGEIFLHKITMVVFMPGAAVVYFLTLRFLSAVTAGKSEEIEHELEQHDGLTELDLVGRKRIQRSREKMSCPSLTERS
jgi:hypothetical protein